MKIEIFGSGCAKCKRLEKNVYKALSDAGVEAQVAKVKDINEMVDRGVMMTPALFIDGHPRAVGRVPTPEEIIEMVKGS